MHTTPNLPPRLPAAGPILGHPTKPRIRFFMADGDGTGAGGTPAGTAPTGDGSTSNSDGVAAPTAEDLTALRGVAEKRLQERNAARDEAKAFRDLGLTPDEIRELKAARDKANGGPSEDQIRAAAQRDADKAAADRYASKARASAVREQATVLGFHSPKAALALLDPVKLSTVTVEDDEADSSAVKELLEQLAKDEPYLIKPAGQQTVDHRTAGIGGVGGATKAEPTPGLGRLRSAYETSSR